MPLNQQQFEEFKKLIRLNETGNRSILTVDTDPFATDPDKAGPLAGQGSQDFAQYIFQNPDASVADLQAKEEEFLDIDALRAVGAAEKMFDFSKLNDRQKFHVSDLFYNQGVDVDTEFPGFTSSIRSGDLRQAAKELLFRNPDGDNTITHLFEQTKSRQIRAAAAFLDIEEDDFDIQDLLPNPGLPLRFTLEPQLGSSQSPFFKDLMVAKEKEPETISVEELTAIVDQAAVPAITLRELNTQVLRSEVQEKIGSRLAVLDSDPEVTKSARDQKDFIRRAVVGMRNLAFKSIGNMQAGMEELGRKQITRFLDPDASIVDETFTAIAVSSQFRAQAIDRIRRSITTDRFVQADILKDIMSLEGNPTFEAETGLRNVDFRVMEDLLNRVVNRKGIQNFEPKDFLIFQDVAEQLMNKSLPPDLRDMLNAASFMLPEDINMKAVERAVRQPFRDARKSRDEIDRERTIALVNFYDLLAPNQTDFTFTELIASGNAFTPEMLVVLASDTGSAFGSQGLPRAAGITAGVLTRSPAVALNVSTFLASAAEGVGTYTETLDRGGSEEEALTNLLGASIFSAGLNWASLAFTMARRGMRVRVPGALAKAKVIIKNGLLEGSVEGLTESLEEVFQGFVLLGDDLKTAIINGINAMPGAFITGTAAGSFSTHVDDVAKTMTDSERLKLVVDRFEEGLDIPGEVALPDTVEVEQIRRQLRKDEPEVAPEVAPAAIEPTEPKVDEIGDHQIVTTVDEVGKTHIEVRENQAHETGVNLDAGTTENQPRQRADLALEPEFASTTNFELQALLSLALAKRSRLATATRDAVDLALKEKVSEDAVQRLQQDLDNATTEATALALRVDSELQNRRRAQHVVVKSKEGQVTTRRLSPEDVETEFFQSASLESTMLLLRSQNAATLLIEEADSPSPNLAAQVAAVEEITETLERAADQGVDLESTPEQVVEQDLKDLNEARVIAGFKLGRGSDLEASVQAFLVEIREAAETGRKPDETTVAALISVIDEARDSGRLTTVERNKILRPVLEVRERARNIIDRTAKRGKQIREAKLFGDESGGALNIFASAFNIIRNRLPSGAKRRRELTMNRLEDTIMNLDGGGLLHTEGFGEEGLTGLGFGASFRSTEAALAGDPIAQAHAGAMIEADMKTSKSSVKAREAVTEFRAQVPEKADRILFRPVMEAIMAGDSAKAQMLSMSQGASHTLGGRIIDAANNIIGMFEKRKVRIKAHLRKMARITKEAGDRVAFEDVITGAKTIDEVVADSRAKDKDKFRSQLEDQLEYWVSIDTWGIDDFITNMELGQIQIQRIEHDEEGNRVPVTVAWAMTPQEAVDKVEQLNAQEPGEFQMVKGPNFNREDYAQLVTPAVAKRLAGDVRDAAEAEFAAIGIEGTQAKEAQRNIVSSIFGSRGLATNKLRRPKAGPFLKRQNILAGEPDITDVLPAYLAAVERKINFDPFVVMMNRDMNKMKKAPRDFLMTRFENVYAPNFWGTQVLGALERHGAVALDKIFRGASRIAPTMFNPTSFAAQSSGQVLIRGASALRRTAGVASLSLRVTAGAINMVGAVINTAVKANAPMMARGVKWAVSPEGKAILDAESKAGTLGDFHADIGLQRQGAGLQSILLATFTWPEPITRRFAFGVMYVQSIREGKSRQAARLQARKFVRLTNFVYNASALPRAFSDPLIGIPLQFKSWFVQQSDFFFGLTPYEKAMFMGMQMLFTGSMGYITFVRAFPLIGPLLEGLGLFDEAEEGLLNIIDETTEPTASNLVKRTVTYGLPGLLGVDITGQAVPQLIPKGAANDFARLVGPVANGLNAMYEEGVSPLMRATLQTEPEGLLEVAGDSRFQGVLNHIENFIERVWPAWYHWNSLVNTVTNPSGDILDMNGQVLVRDPSGAGASMAQAAMALGAQPLAGSVERTRARLIRNDLKRVTLATTENSKQIREELGKIPINEMVLVFATQGMTANMRGRVAVGLANKYIGENSNIMLNYEAISAVTPFDPGRRMLSLFEERVMRMTPTERAAAQLPTAALFEDPNIAPLETYMRLKGLLKK